LQKNFAKRGEKPKNFLKSKKLSTKKNDKCHLELRSEEKTHLS
jgi:hypothetical protein